VCELCTPHDDIDGVVARLETRFGTPLLTGIKAAGAARPDAQVVFAGRPASLLLEGAPASVRVDGRDISEPFSVNVRAARIAFPIGALWAMQRVQWLEERLALRPFEDEAIRPEIVRIALEWHLSSRFTSFVCVDHSTTTHGERRHVVQPTELPETWEIAEPAPTNITAMARHMSSSAVAMFAASSTDAPHLAEAMEMPTFIRRLVDAEPTGGATPRARSALPVQAPSKPSRLSDVTLLGSLSTYLARNQSANGSYGNSVPGTCAALILLLLHGNTRIKGDRRRVVQKAAEWLQMQPPTDLIRLTLEALDETERAGAIPHRDWSVFISDTPEGQLLLEFWQQLTP